MPGLLAIVSEKIDIQSFDIDYKSLSALNLKKQIYQNHPSCHSEQSEKNKKFNESTPCHPEQSETGEIVDSSIIEKTSPAGLNNVKSCGGNNVPTSCHSWLDQTNKVLYSSIYSLRFERFTNQKFLNDKIFQDDEDVFIAIEGVIHNIQKLQKKYSCTDYFSTVKKMFFQQGENFYDEFRGDFSGIIYDKKNNKILSFTNHIGSKPLFYFKDAEVTIISSEIKIITQILKKLNKTYSLDVTASYMLLSYGFMLADFTTIKEIRKLTAGSYIKIENDNFEIKTYKNFGEEEISKNSENELISEFDDLFTQAVKLEYEKDLEYGYKHIATLSGGLDSRANVMLAHELGYSDITNMTFSESDYQDETIAKQIARDLGQQFLFYALDNGNYLKNIENPVLANDGQVLYSGAAHHLTMTGLINHDNFGLQHTGMLGDAVLGTYIKSLTDSKPQISDGATSKKLIHKIKAEATEIISKFQTSEHFYLYNRGFNAIFNGYWMTQQYTEFSSPFLNVDFLDFCMRIPAKFKFKEQLYINWFLRKHPEFAKYPWEGAMMKIGSWTAFSKAVSFAKRAFRGVRRRTFGSYRGISMNPFDFWMQTNNSLRDFMCAYFTQNIELLADYPELQADCSELFKTGNTSEKTQVLTLLAGIKLLWE